MPATFKVIGTHELKLREKNLFVVYGSIASGVVKLGMKLKIGCDVASDTVRPIVGIEMIDHIGEGRSDVGLAVQYQDESDLASLRATEVVGKELTVDD